MGLGGMGSEYEQGALYGISIINKDIILGEK